MKIFEGRPFLGADLMKLKQFLKKMNLEYDEAIEYSFCILDESYEIIGTGSVDNNVIKCVAIDPKHQGEGLSSIIITNLIQYEFEKNKTHIFIYTKPENLLMFSDMGFYTILQTKEILFMENKLKGFEHFLETLKKETPNAALDRKCVIGSIVANCNPFTLGHRYLIEYASKCCDFLHLFILSDNRNYFSADQRFEMVKLGVEDIDNVILHRTSDYMISAATFPTYFFKDQMQGKVANCELDLEIFGTKIAPILGISKRFVGMEPFCQVTNAYNGAMKQKLPILGIEIEEIERKSENEIPISASRVRKYLAGHEYEKVATLVPYFVYEYLMDIIRT